MSTLEVNHPSPTITSNELESEISRLKHRIQELEAEIRRKHAQLNQASDNCMMNTEPEVISVCGA